MSYLELGTVFSSTPQTAENGGTCSACSAPLKGRFTRHYSSTDSRGHRSWCDDCIEKWWIEVGGGIDVTGPITRGRRQHRTQGAAA